MSDESTAPVAEESTAPVEEAEAEESTEEPVEVKKAEAPKSTKRKYTPKVNGRQREIELDPNNDEEMMKYLSKAMAADEKFEEAATLRKSVEMLVQELKTNPRSVLSHPELGLDLMKFAQDIINESIEEEQKTPEQRELEQLKKQLADKTTREKQLEDEKTTAERARMEEQAFKQFDDDITAALETSKLPKSPYVVKRIADTLIEAVNMGYTDATVQQILPIVEEQINNEIQRMFETMPEDVMEKMIGSKNLERVRKKRLSSKGKPVSTANQVQSTGKTSKDAEQSKEKPVKFRDLFGAF